MNTKARLLALVGVALLVVAGSASAADRNTNRANTSPTAQIDTPPRQMDNTRTGGNDSTMQGGAGWVFDPTRIRLPSECERNPSARGCPNFCAANPSDPACTPPPPPTFCQQFPNDPACQPDPVVDPCLIDPTLPECGGGNVCAADPFAAGCPTPTVRGGCMVDTRAFDQISEDRCTGVGETTTDLILFSVGDRIHSGGEVFEFIDPSRYRVVWSGTCNLPNGDMPPPSQCYVHRPTTAWRNSFAQRSVTVYRNSDNSIVYMGTIRAEKETCNPSREPFGQCPEQP